MALPILDGNQTATTLSTVLSAGAHIPAHTVVSLGAQAITDMRSAVSGSVVSISNLPATQTIAGTVTASVTNSVTVGSLPVQLSTTTIGGTARLNVTLSSATTVGNTAPSYANLYGGSDGTNLRAILTDTSGRTVVTVSNFPSVQPVSLASLPSLAAGTAQIGSVTASIFGKSSTGVQHQITVGDSYTSFIDTGGMGRVAVEIIDQDGATVIDNGKIKITGTVTASVASTTVTISNFPRPTWTNYSGTIATAGTAVTAISTISRSYLLAQVTTGQMFINIGATATTLNSVYFSAGQGFAWETSVPQGIVSIISPVTGTNYVLKDG